MTEPQYKKYRPENYILTDIFTNVDEASKENLEKTPLWATRRTHRLSVILTPSLWVVLVLVGILSAIVAFLNDLLCEKLRLLRTHVASTDSSWLNLAIWLSFSLSLTLFAGYLCKFADAEGSGLPEMKSIIAGVHIPEYFRLKTFLIKSVGVISAYGGGLSIGREGPFVHFSGIIAHRLAKLKCFRHLHKNPTYYRQILGASVAAGIASALGAPIGGVLFSIEVASSFYYVSNLWKGFFCSIFCVITFTLLKMSDLTDLVYDTKFEAFEVTVEVFFFAVLGLFCGIIGVIFIKTSSSLINYRLENKIPWMHSRFMYIIIVTVLSALVAFPKNFLRLSDKDVINEMFKAKELSNYPGNDWASPGIGLNLAFFTTVKLSLTALSISLQVPSGVFAPVFTAGAALGRLGGFLVDSFVGTEHSGVYAVVGAASLTSSVTHTMSVAVIVFELTGQIHYVLPMLIAVVVSFAVSNAFSMSIYDVLLEMKGLPYLPALKPSRLYSLNAEHIMKPCRCALSHKATLKEVGQCVRDTKHLALKIPILGNKKILIGAVNGYILKKRLCKIFKHLEIDSGMKEKLKKFFVEKNKEAMDFEETFWDQPFEFEGLNVDYAPFSIYAGTPLAKVHFLFVMLGIMTIFVTSRGRLLGVISRTNFTKCF